jgi:hypothetical protein
MLRSRSTTRRGVLVAFGLAVAPLALGLSSTACVSPTLPLPPPETPIVSQGSALNRVVLTAGKGGAKANAFIITINQNPSIPREERVAGTQAEADGSWRVELFAEPGDRIDITQESGTERSPSLSVTIPAR